jgi:hypothetical protein
MNNAQEATDTKIKKTQCKKTYMREYMRKYNLKKYGEKIKKTEDDKKESLRQSHKKYYLRNKATILKAQKEKVKINRIVRLKKQLEELEGGL